MIPEQLTVFLKRFMMTAATIFRFTYIPR